MDFQKRAEQLRHQSLHRDIEYGKYGKVEEFIDKYPFETCVYVKEKSAIAVALFCKELEIYELLILHGFTFGPHEFENVKTQLDGALKDELLQIHLKYVKDSTLKHLSVLISKSKLSHNTLDKNRRKFQKEIVKTFEELNEIEWIEPLLKFAATGDELKIVFDFNSDSVDEIDPGVPENVRGVTYYAENCITIGAIDLLDNERRRYVRGTLAHELCHFAMHLLYKNMRKPYKENDKVKQQQFDEIVKMCEKNKTLEHYIKLVYANYKPDKWHCELIVRVPHLLALYKDNAEKREEVKQKDFSELFNFFELNVLPDLERELPMMEAKKEIKEINEICGVSAHLEAFELSLATENLSSLNFELKNEEKVQIISSNCVQLTMTSVYQKLKWQEKLSAVIFLKLETSKNENILYLITKSLKKFPETAIIVECSCEKTQEILEVFEKFKSKEITKNLTIVCDEKLKLEVLPFDDEIKVSVTHSWSQLTKNSQEKLMETQVKFQGKEMKLKEIFAENLKAIEAILLDDLVIGKEINIGREIEFPEVEIYVERKFLTSHAKCNSWTKKYDPEPLRIDEISKIAQDKKVVLLADEPGNGKSTEMKMIAKKLKEKFPTFWVQYFDLKQFTKVFQKDGNVSMKFNKIEEVAKFLVEMLKLEGFVARVFVEMFVSGCVIGLFDGVDEISPSFLEFVTNLMSGIRRNSKNQLWIATRPHLARELEGKLKTKSFKLKPFGNENRQEFFEKFFEAKGFEIQQNEEITEEIGKFLKTLEPTYNNYFVSNPQLLRMIAELFEDDVNFQLAHANLYSIYDNFVYKMIRKLAKKGSQANEDSTKFIKNFNIIECHQKKALEVMFQSDFDNWKGSFDGYNFRLMTEIIELSFNNTLDLSVDQMVRIGLMFNDGTGKLHFIHRTFVEFFVAQFISEKMFKLKFHSENELNAVVKLFRKVMDQSYKMIRKFLDEQIRNFEFDRNNEKSAKVIECIDKSIRVKFLKQSAYDGCMNLLKFVSLQVIRDKQKLLHVWLGHGYSDSLLMNATEEQPFEFLWKIWELLTKVFTQSQVKELLILETQDSRNVLHFALRNTNDERPFRFLLKKAREILNPGEFKLFQNPRRPLWDQTIGYFDTTSESLKKIVLRCKENFNKNEFEEFLMSRNEDRYRPLAEFFLHNTCRKFNAESVQFVLDELVDNIGLIRTKKLCTKAKGSESALTFAARNIKEEEKDNIFETLLNFIESNFDNDEKKNILMEEGEEFWNEFYLKPEKRNIKNLELFENIFEEKYRNEKAKKEPLADENGENALFCAMKLKDKSTAQATWDVMQKLFDDKTLKKILVKRNKKGKNMFDDFRYYKLEIFEPFIARTCTDNETQETFEVWILVVDYFLGSFVQKLSSIVEQNSEFAASFYRKLFQFQDENNTNILQCPRSRDHKWEGQRNVEYVLLEKAKKFLSEAEILIKIAGSTDVFCENCNNNLSYPVKEQSRECQVCVKVLCVSCTKQFYQIKAMKTGGKTCKSFFFCEDCFPGTDAYKWYDSDALPTSSNNSINKNAQKINKITSKPSNNNESSVNLGDQKTVKMIEKITKQYEETKQELIEYREASQLEISNLRQHVEELTVCVLKQKDIIQELKSGNGKTKEELFENIANNFQQQQQNF